MSSDGWRNLKQVSKVESIYTTSVLCVSITLTHTHETFRDAYKLDEIGRIIATCQSHLFASEREQ